MSRFIIISLVILLLAGCLAAPETEVNQFGWRDIKVASTPLKVELAITPEQQRQGLSWRDSLIPGTGMLFKFAQADKYTFWMKDMKFALDFIWLKDGKVVQLNTNIPPPNQDFPEPKTLQANQPVDAVIEVPAGWIEQNQIKVGDLIIGEY